MAQTKSIADEGYIAASKGKKLEDNPYQSESDSYHWEWRKGWIEYQQEAH